MYGHFAYHDDMRTFSRLLGLVLVAGLVAAACSSDASDEAIDTTGIRLIDAAAAANMQSSPPEDLVILDVRTPEEFGEGHLEGATMIDFYREDFAAQLEQLDPEVPYLLYCRSGNRSGQTADIMRELGFSDVSDVDGGIIAWNDLELPTVTP